MNDPFSGQPLYFQSRLQSVGTSLTTATNVNVTANPLVLPFGDYLISGSVGVTIAGGTTLTQIVAATSLVSATLPAADTICVPTAGECQSIFDMASSTLSGQRTNMVYIPSFRLSVPAAGVTLYLVAQASFGVSTAVVFGSFQATPIG